MLVFCYLEWSVNVAAKWWIMLLIYGNTEIDYVELHQIM